MDKRKIGIVTFHRAHNYGAMLQAYALLEFLNRKYNAEIIDYYAKRIYANYNVFRPLSKNPFKAVKNFKEDYTNRYIKRERYNKFERFMKNNYNLSNIYINEHQLKKNISKYDVLITGSDQVWNPDIVGGLSDIYTLNFGDIDTKKISYAASIGSTKYIDNNPEIFKSKLKNINFISVRESDAAQKLEVLMNRSIDVVLDPTLLLDTNEWESKLDNIKENEKYILAYMVKYDQNFINVVNHFSKVTGLKVIHFGLNNPGYENELKSCYNADPYDFINYIKNAEYVLATSFHATVFSIIFNKKFWIVPHFLTNSRVTSLLDLFGLSNRIIKSLDDFDDNDIYNNINYEEVNKLLDKKREESKRWLYNCIEAGEFNE